MCVCVRPGQYYCREGRGMRCGWWFQRKVKARKISASGKASAGDGPRKVMKTATMHRGNERRAGGDDMVRLYFVSLVGLGFWQRKRRLVGVGVVVNKEKLKQQAMKEVVGHGSARKRING